MPVIRTAAAALTGALVLTLTSACGGSSDEPSGTADETTPPAHATAPAATAADWLVSQLTGGLVHNEQYDFDDYGLSVDTALALDQAGGHDDVVKQVGGKVADNVKSYVAPGYGTLTSAGATAKTLVLAQQIDADPTSYGGVDLVDSLQALVTAGGPAAGRLHDHVDPRDKKAADYANVIAQAFGTWGLAAADSDAAPSATDFLLEQQCKDGWFRLSFTADPRAEDQSCDGDRTSKPDVDATAFAVIALAGQADDDAVSESLDRAVGWLEQEQADDGSFATGSPAVANSNSTGVAGWALAEADETGAAEQAASWLAAHELGVGACGPDGTAGAVAYDDAALQTGTKNGIGKKTADQFRRATAQALPALRWVPADAPTRSC